jgi:hypothetical protein
MLSFQVANLDCTAKEQNLEAYYYSYIYPRPKSASQINNLFKNSITRNGDLFEIILCQAWDTFDRKLVGFEYDIPNAFKNRENASSIHLQFSISKSGFFVVHSLVEYGDLYYESLNQMSCSFFNRKSKILRINQESSSLCGLIFQEIHKLHFCSEETLPKFNHLFEFDFFNPRTASEQFIKVIPTLFIDEEEVENVKKQLELEVFKLEVKENSEFKV